MHAGRVLACKGRKSKKWSLDPLLDRCKRKSVDGSFRGMGAETLQEVGDNIAKRLRTGCVQSCDSALALKAANKDPRLKHVPLITVVHGDPKSQKRQFVKNCALKVSRMKPSLQKTLNGGKAVKPGTRKLKVKAGSNCCEGLFGSISKLQSRMNVRRSWKS